MYKSISSAFLLLSLAGLAGAARVKVWHHNRPGDHDRAKLSGLVMTSTGSLRLARKLRALTGLDSTHVWALAEDRAGNLYAGTGDEGKVFRVSPQGKATLAYTSEHSQVLALAVDPKGE